MLVRSATAAAIVALLAGCGAGTLSRVQPQAGAPPASPPPSAVVEPDIVAAAFRPVGATPEARAFDVAWETGRCQFFHSLDVVERADAVVVTVRERIKKDSLCPDAGIRARRRVELAEPLGERTIYNGGATPPFAVSN